MFCFLSDIFEGHGLLHGFLLCPMPQCNTLYIGYCIEYAYILGCREKNVLPVSAKVSIYMAPVPYASVIEIYRIYWSN